MTTKDTNHTKEVGDLVTANDTNEILLSFRVIRVFRGKGPRLGRIIDNPARKRGIPDKSLARASGYQKQPAKQGIEASPIREDRCGVPSH